MDANYLCIVYSVVNTQCLNRQIKRKYKRFQTLNNGWEYSHYLCVWCTEYRYTWYCLTSGAKFIAKNTFGKMLDKMQANQVWKMAESVSWLYYNDLQWIKYPTWVSYYVRWTILLYYMCTFAPMERLRQLLSEFRKSKKIFEDFLFFSLNFCIEESSKHHLFWFSTSSTDRNLNHDVLNVPWSVSPNICCK